MYLVSSQIMNTVFLENNNYLKQETGVLIKSLLSMSIIIAPFLELGFSPHTQ